MSVTIYDFIYGRLSDDLLDICFSLFFFFSLLVIPGFECSLSLSPFFPPFLSVVL